MNLSVLIKIHQIQCLIHDYRTIAEDSIYIDSDQIYQKDLIFNHIELVVQELENLLKTVTYCESITSDSSGFTEDKSF